VRQEGLELAPWAAADAIDEEIGAGAQALEIGDKLQVQRCFAGKREGGEGAAVEDRKSKQVFIAERTGARVA
jgi:hypothetical protein